MAPPHLPENVYLFGPAPLPAMLLLPTFNARLLPCLESWAAMVPHAQGRHCARCQRVVQDFSESLNPTADLAAARAASPDGRVCGRFAGAQVQGPQPLTRRRWFLMALVLVVTQGLSAREALAQVQGVQHKTKFVKPAKRVELLGDIEELPTKLAPSKSRQALITRLEQMPVFEKKGFNSGSSGVADYIERNIMYQPGFPEGKVYITFVVDTAGQMQNPTVVKGLSPAADAEVIRVVKAMDEFTPGMNNGRPVAVPYTLPITSRKPPYPIILYLRP